MNAGPGRGVGAGRNPRRATRALGGAQRRGSRYVREDNVAAVYLALSDTARTLEWLGRGLDAQAANMADQSQLEIQAAAWLPALRRHREKGGVAAVAMIRVAAALADRPLARVGDGASLHAARDFPQAAEPGCRLDVAEATGGAVQPGMASSGWCVC